MSPHPSDPADLHWQFAGRTWIPGPLPRLMGILNVTPDSFSDGGQFIDFDAAIARGRQLVEAGADVLDIGGESTRPGATPVDVDTELQRVIPVIGRLASELAVPISIDTMKAEVARQALAAGACIVNDVAAGRFDPDLFRVCAASDCGVIVMHMQGTPQTMQAAPLYRDVVTEVRQFLRERVTACEQAGIDRQRIVVDPGIGFGKTATHNVTLLTHVADLRNDGRPVLIGHSRKRFLFQLLGRETDERLAGTLGVSISLAMQGADLLRVHDVAAVRDALRTWHATRPEKDVQRIANAHESHTQPICGIREIAANRSMA